MLSVIEAYRTGLCVFDLLQSSVVVFNYLKVLCRFVLHGLARITMNVNINLKKKVFTLESASRKCRIWSDTRGGPFVIKVARKIEYIF